MLRLVIARMRTNILPSLIAVVSLALSSSAFAAGKDYQVTGPILEVTDTMIAVQKGKDRWEIARDSSTKSSGDMKVGDKVLIHYTMTATNIEAAKGGKAEKGAKKEEASPAASPKKK